MIFLKESGQTELFRCRAERQPQAGRQKQIVAFDSKGRIAYVVVGKGDLPSKPVLQLRRSRGIERKAITASAANAGEESKILAKRRAAVHVCIQLLADYDFRAFLRDCWKCQSWGRRRRIRQGVGRKIFLVVAGSAKKIERRRLRFDQVVASTTCNHVLKV